MLNKVNVQTKEQKFCVILRWIEKNKNILFDQHSTYHFNLWATKWQEIYKEAVKLDIAPAQKGWKYLKDDLWQKWKAQTMEKVSDPDPEECKVRTLTSLNESDKIICNILGLKVEPVEILAIKDEIDKESGDEDIEISSDDDDVILQSASSSTSSLKPCNITFIPVQKTKDINSKSLLPLSRNSKIKFIGTTPSTSNERVTYNLNSNEDIVWRDLKTKVKKKMYEHSEEIMINGSLDNKLHLFSQMEEAVVKLLLPNFSMKPSGEMLDLDENTTRTSILEEQENISELNCHIESNTENVNDESEPIVENCKPEKKRLKKIQRMHNNERLRLLKQQINSQKQYHESVTDVMHNIQKSLQCINKYTRGNYYANERYRKRKLELKQKKLELLEQEIKNKENNRMNQEIYRRSKLEMNYKFDSTKHTENNFDKLDTTADTTLQFLSETKNTHKMILENVRDIKMKLLMQKKSTHCETCNNTNKEMLSVQNQILEVQQQNLQIQMQIIQEIKNVSEHLLNKIQKNNTPEGSEKDEKEKYGNLLNSESNGESSNEEDPLTNMQTRKRFKK